MTIETLIEALVRETGRLIAQLARLRYPLPSLERLPEVLRATIVTELTAAGERDAVVADAMGVTIRSVRQWRKAESTPRARTLAQRILDWLEMNGAATREQLEGALCRQGAENREAFTTLLRHLTEHGLLQSAVNRGRRIYVRTDLLNHGRWDDRAELACQIQARLVDLGTISGEAGSTREAIFDALGIDPRDEERRAAVLDALAYLEDRERIRKWVADDGSVRLTGRTFVRPADAEHGLATSLFEHIKAVMRNVSRRAKAVGSAAVGQPDPGLHRGATFELAIPRGWDTHQQAGCDVITAASSQLSALRVQLDREACDALSLDPRPGVLLTVYLGFSGQQTENLPAPSRREQGE